MAVLFDKEKKTVMVTCHDGCDNGVTMKIEDPWDGFDSLEAKEFCWVSYVSGNFYRDQHGACDIIKDKFKRIWNILRNKDIYYSDIMMTKDDFMQFKEFVNNVEV